MKSALPIGAAVQTLLQEAEAPLGGELYGSVLRTL